MICAEKQITDLLYLPWSDAVEGFEKLYFSRDQEKIKSARRQMEIVAKAVTEETGVSGPALRSRVTKHNVTLARYILFYVAREVVKLPFDVIMEYVGRGCGTVDRGLDMMRHCVENNTREKKTIERVQARVLQALEQQTKTPKL